MVKYQDSVKNSSYILVLKEFQSLNIISGSNITIFQCCNKNLSVLSVYAFLHEESSRGRGWSYNTSVMNFSVRSLGSPMTVSTPPTYNITT